MATLPLSFTIKPRLVIYNGTESYKVIACNHSINGKRVDKMNLSRHASSYRDIKEYTYNMRNRNVGILSQSRGSIVQGEDQYIFHFRTEIDGLVKIIVRKKNLKYNVSFEVSSSEPCLVENKVVMSWGIYRSDSSKFLPLDSQIGTLGAESEAVETPFVHTTEGRLALELEFEGTLAPFYLSFLLKSLGGSKSSDIRSHRKTRFCVPIGLGRGYPGPLGPSFSADGSMNFAVFSRSAKGMILCLYDDTKAETPTLEIDLDPIVNRSGDIWHVAVNSTTPYVTYGYRCKGGSENVILDPYAKVIADSYRGLVSNRLGKLVKEPEFDWTNDAFPCIPMEKLVVYRINPSCFTQHESSKLGNDVSGTFSGIVKKLNHLKDLGVNAILLEPVFSFDEHEGPYFPTHFFAPADLYGPINSMKEMVKTLHSNGIEVLLEVAFTHTADGCSLKAIDKSSYYYGVGQEDPRTRNALNCNYPVVQQFILDALRYWLVEFRVDGFCFIDSSSLLKGAHGELLSRPPLLESIAFDPILSKAKIIADTWDPSNKAPKEEVPFPHWKRWAETNPKFCGDVRNFLRGEGLLSDLATRLCGSGDIFLNGRGPAFSFNYITRNSGLSLVDVVSFSGDDLAPELSWNCGEEGPTNNPVVLEKRLKQIRNFLFILFVSLGVPVLNMGDEYGQSSGGSTLYGDRKLFDWNGLRTGFGVQTTKFISFLTSLRKRRSDLFQKRSFLKEENIEWHGTDLSPPDWEDPTSKFLAMTLKVDEEDIDISSPGADLYVSFNAGDEPESIILPPPPLDMAWYRLVDTAFPFPGFFSEDGDLVVEQMDGLVTYEAKSHSCALFEARSLK